MNRFIVARNTSMVLNDKYVLCDFDGKRKWWWVTCNGGYGPDSYVWKYPYQEKGAPYEPV